MFNINEWKLKLKPTINTSDVRDSLGNLSKTITSETLPLLLDIQAAHEAGFSGKDTKFYLKAERELKENLRVLKFKFKNNDTTDPIEVCIKLMENMVILIPWISDQFKSRMVTTEAMDMRQSNLIQLVDLCEFVQNYVVNFTNVYSFYHLKDKMPNYSGGLTPTVEEKVSDDLWAFSISTTIIGRELNDIKSAAGRIPAIIADHERFYELMQSVGRSNADPLDLTSPPFPLSILFMIQVSMANAQMDRLEKAESNAKAVRYRLALAKRYEASGVGDAATEVSIKAYEDQLLKLERKIDKMERQYGLKK